MRYILLPLLIISYNAIFAQRPDWNEIENSIGKKRNLYDLTLQLETIKQEALRTKNYPLAARCYWNLVLITDHKMEDSSYFKNSMSIDSVGKHISDPLLRSIMLVLKAKRISFYRHRFSYRSDKNLYAIPAGSIDYGRFSGPELDSLADMHLQQARAISITLTNVKVDDLLWLSTDPLLFLFTPVYTDIIFAEQLHTRALPSYNVVHNFKDTNWILSAPGEFISRQIPETDLNYPMFRIYRDWVNFNRHDSANFYFIESLAKKYFYGRSSKTANSTRLYETWLLQQLQSPHSIIRANTIYQLCTEWIKKGDGYTFKRDNYYNPEFTASPAYFDTAVRWHYVKALSLMENNSRLLDSFFYLKRNLLLLKDQVTQKKLSIINQSHYLPDEPIQLQSNFKNTDSIHFKVVKLNTGVGRFKKSNFSSDTLLHLPAFKNFSIAMPAARDYQEHSTLIDAGSLPKGYYAVLFSDTAINASMNVVDYFLMDVTNIAAINNDKRLFILHRKTGLPLNNASPLLQYTAPAKKPLPKPLVKKINADGYVIVSTEDIASARVTWGDDTSFISINEMENETPDELYDKDDYEDLAEYYEENLQIHLFTDRSIYRPGQTMHFKGMVFTRAPATGKMIPFHKKHLQFPALKKMFNADVKEFLKEKLEVFITDPFGKYADTIEVSVNEYGSFTGSYTISKDAATGDWDFDTDYVELNDRNDGHFKVEEYKRPTFELQLEKPAAFLQLGDSFVVKARLRSFAGALLNNVKLNYTIDVRSSDLRTKNSVDGDNSNYIDISIADSSGYTDNNGELLIKIPATFLPAYEFKKDGSSTAGYYLEVTAADATGESQQASLKVSLSNRPVNINYSLAAAYEKKSAGLISVTTKNEFAGEISRQLKVNIFRLDKKAAPGYAAEEMDYLLENGKWIYRINYPNGNDADTSLVYETSLLSNSGKLDLQKAMLPAGNYLVKITSNENGRIIGETARNFSVFDMEGQTIPAGAEDFYHLPFNSVAKGETIKWYYGTTKNDINTIYHVQYFAKTKQGMRSEYLYSLQPGKTGINTFSFKIPADAAGEKIILTQLYIKDNDFFAKSVDLYLQQEASDRPEIIVERYRQKLTPGSKEKFSVSIKTRSEKIAAELMTVIYDASLDKIEPHEWRVPRDEIRYYPGEQWQTDIRSLNTTTLGGVEPWNYVFPFSTNRAQPMWWMNEADSIYMDVNKDSRLGLNGDYRHISSYALQGKVSGISLAEVVTVGYVTRRADRSSGAVLKRIRGANSFASANSGLVIIDGVPYTGDLSKFNADLITDISVLEGADATAIFGSQASEGVIIISTKGKIVLPNPDEPPVTIRKNFAETAFFLPNVYADANGYYNISFEIPEAVTTWNWKMLAATKDLRFAYTQRLITTQLPMMVQPNMPRYLFQGDEISLQTRISNLDALHLSGNSECIIEDAVTGDNMNALLVKNKQPFSVDAKSNSSIAYQLKIPEGLLNPLKIKITARAGSFADGEEYIIPVLSKRVLVTQSIPFVYSNKKDSSIAVPSLPKDAFMYGIGININPQPQAALINALPSLAFYPYNCAEQTFNKLLAHSIAVKLLRRDSVAQQTLQYYKTKTREAYSNSKPGELSEETMPWLQLNHATALQQEQLLKLFDTLRSMSMIDQYRNELMALQNADGGISWFKGGKSNPYISNYLLAGFGMLKQDSLPLFYNTHDNLPLLPPLVKYSDRLFTANHFVGEQALFYLYARNFWLKDYPLAEHAKTKADSLLTTLWAKSGGFSLEKQALLIVTSMQHKSGSFYNVALKQLESIRQLAVNDDINGIRWKDISNSDDFENNHEETIALLATSFDKTGYSKNVVDGIIKWLLQAKAQHSWSNTKATAAVVNLLHKNGQPATGMPATLQAVAGDSAITVTNNLLQGQLSAFKRMHNFPVTVTLKNSGNEMATGALNFYYFSAEAPASVLPGMVKIWRHYFKLNKQGSWEPVNESTVFSITDKMKTVITINTPRQLKYVFIDEKRPACSEPLDAMSGYDYGSGFSYYRSVRDAGYQFFAEQIPSGISTIEYETNISKEGSFSSGTVSLQCMYQPQVNAYGGGRVIRSK